MEDLLNLHQPWDCERFPKSKTICYGGGGGGGGGDPVKAVKKVVSDNTPTVKVETPKVTTPKITTPKITTPKITTPKVPSVTDIKKSVSNTIEDVQSGASSTIESVKSGASSTIESVKSDVAKSDIGRGVSSTIESVKSDVARSDLGSGAIEDAVKRSDLGIISNQAKDVLNAPGAYIGRKTEEFKQYAKDRFGVNKDEGGDSGSSAASTSGQGPGQFATIGSGSQEGMKGSGTMRSGRQRARQNKRALRIASR